jgi:excisionase family DNA binding protein
LTAIAGHRQALAFATISMSRSFVEDIGMRTRPFSEAKDPVSDLSSARAPTARRAAGAIPKFFTIEQVSELLGVSLRTISRRIKAGLLVAYRSGGVVRIAEHDLRGVPPPARVKEYIDE